MNNVLVLLLTFFSCFNLAGNADDKASFSYQLDGVKISGGATDITFFNNAAQIDKNNDKTGRLQFFLNDAAKEEDDVFPHSLRFVIPAKTGATTLSTDEENWNVGLFISQGNDGKYIIYQNETFIINITSISATRVTGGFSGKLKLVEGQPGKKQEVIVNNGSFDLPVRK